MLAVSPSKSRQSDFTPQEQPLAVIGSEQALSVMDGEKVVGRAQTHPSKVPLNTTHSRQPVTLDIYCLAGDTGIDWTCNIYWLLAYREADLAASFTRFWTTGLDFTGPDSCALDLTRTGLINITLAFGYSTTINRSTWLPNRESCLSSSWETIS